jgi:hypothetical protein
MVIFCLLPDSKKYNAFNHPNVSRTGTWGVPINLNQTQTYGIGSSTINDAITATNLSGRYIGVSFDISQNQLNPNDQSMRLVIDGVTYMSDMRLCPAPSRLPYMLSYCFIPRSILTPFQCVPD